MIQLETIDYAVENNMSFADIMVKEEMELSGKSRDEVRAQMKQNLDVMRDAVIKGTTGDGVESVTATLVMTLLNYVIIMKHIMLCLDMK